MSDRKGFDLGDYVEVKDRIKLFYELYGNGRLVTDHVEMLTAPDGKQRVMVTARAYRAPDDPLPGVGTSWMELPGNTPYTKGSEVENAETSAWGRAIGALGILIDRSIASANEVRDKGGEEAPVPAKPKPVDHDAGGLVGNAQVGTGKSDFELRQEPDGWVISFKLVQGRQGIKVVAHGTLAQAVATLRPTIEGKTVTCWGSVSEESFKKDGREIKYRVLTLSRIQTPDGTLPAPEPGLEEPPDDVELAVA